jgi:signal peptidase I
MSTPLKDKFSAGKGKWIRFSIWALITVLFSLWTSSAWWLFALPFFFDLYITRLLPWGFWKKSKNKTFRSVMDWVDAIVFALVAVYIINIYFFQNYQIPSSSLEKSLLVGDFLFVSKVNYGPRVPNTPIAFPLAHHTLPILKCKSYLDKPHWGYKRVPGFAHIKRNDIVVFNFPAGDSVPLAFTNPDYYSLCYRMAEENNVDPVIAKEYVKSHPEVFGKLVYRPVDRREHYVKRCIGLPGETLEVRNNVVFIDGKKIEDQPGVQYNYYVQTKGSYISDQIFRRWGISKEDRTIISEDDFRAKTLPFRRSIEGRMNPIYQIPATKEVIENIRKNPIIDTVIMEPDVLGDYEIGGYTYPLTPANKWKRDHYGPIWIPKKGSILTLTAENLPIYERVIRNYEGQKLVIKDGKVYINGQATNQYTFHLDYFWMMGDNRHNSADSRAWGFVPEDHVVGKPICVWLSLDKDRGLLDGKIRWKRFFKKAY